MNKTKKISTPSINKETQKDMQKLVMARIQAASDDLRIAIGSKEYTKEEMLRSVVALDELGQEIINIQIEYLRDVAKGAIYKEDNE